MNKKTVQIYDNATKEVFMNEIYPKREPAVLKGIDIGACVHTWTVEYLCHQLQDTEVKVHVSNDTKLDFINKNFIYRTLPFETFLQRASEVTHKEFFTSQDEVYYLRSLGDNPRKEVADIRKQFPQLSPDLHLPQLFDEGAFFSSVFRIGSKGMQLWTHYDVMDNILVQVVGSKRVMLYSPQQVDYMYMMGDKSAVLDIDNVDEHKFPLFNQVESYECLLEPGDILFIPALWFHNVTSIDFAISVNVFWRHLDNSCYDNRDTYGNKDLKAMFRCSQMMDRMVKTLHELPSEYRDFYARILSAELRSKCLMDSS